MTEPRRRRKATSPEYDLPEIDYPEASSAPQQWRTYDLNADGYENWQFTCLQPDMKNWAQAMRVAAPIFDEISEEFEPGGQRLNPAQVLRYFQKFGDLWDDVAKVAAQVVVSWNFRDTDGEELPQPFHNYKTIHALPTAVARPFGMDVLNFLAWTSGGEEESECIHCAEPVQAAWSYCPRCKKPIQARCKECSRPLESDWTACPYCGAVVEPEKN